MPENLNTVNSTIPLYIVICTLARSGNFLNKYKSSLAMRYLTPLINSVFYYNFQLFLHEMKVFCSKLYQCQKWKNRLICNFLNGTTPVLFNFQNQRKIADVCPIMTQRGKCATLRSSPNFHIFYFVFDIPTNLQIVFFFF